MSKSIAKQGKVDRSSTASSHYANFDLDQVLKKLNGLRSEYVELKGGAREKLYRGLAEVCAQAHRLNHDPSLWEAFCCHPFWDDNPKARPRAEDRGKALRYLMRWYCGPGKAASKKASFYASRLERFKLGPNPKRWYALLKYHGGVTNLPEEIVLPPPSENAPINKRARSLAASTPSVAEPSKSPAPLEMPEPKKKAYFELELAEDVHLYAVDASQPVFIKIDDYVSGDVNTGTLVLIGTPTEVGF